MLLTPVLLVVGNMHGYIKIWVRSGLRLDELLRFRAHTDGVLSIACSDAHDVMTTVRIDEEIKVWRIKPFSLVGALGKARKWHLGDPSTFAGCSARVWFGPFRQRNAKAGRVGCHSRLPNCDATGSKNHRSLQPISLFARPARAHGRLNETSRRGGCEDLRMQSGRAIIGSGTDPRCTPMWSSSSCPGPARRGELDRGH
jgi:hypothetical protein